jgi:hypothetical protein
MSNTYSIRIYRSNIMECKGLVLPTDVLAVAKVEYLNYLKLTEKPCLEIGTVIIADNKMPEYL